MENSYEFNQTGSVTEASKSKNFLYTKIIKSVIMGLLPRFKIKSLEKSIKILESNVVDLNKTIDNLKKENERLLLKSQLIGVSGNSIQRIEDLFLLINRDQISGLLNWPELLENSSKHGFSDLLYLLKLFSQANDNDTFSNCWELLSLKNFDQLLTEGFNSFKRTIGHNYFNFLVQEGDPQIEAAEKFFSSDVLNNLRQKASLVSSNLDDTSKVQFSYNYFVFLLWEYAKRIDIEHHLDKLEEPKEGNPLLVFSDGKSMSQDLANSVIEYYSIDNSVSFQNINAVLEIGGGYGRNAHVILSINPHIKVILTDILPALYISQRYLSSVFKDRKIFQVRHFASYEDIQEEFESASIIFLMPHQLSLIPDKHIDLTMNISSFGEMNLKQIQKYFTQINRLTKQCFYTKQWEKSQNPFDNLVIGKEDYFYPSSWEQIYSRKCAIQADFFEALYHVRSTVC